VLIRSSVSTVQNQIGFRYQKLENSSFRRSLGLPVNKSGILVTEVATLGAWADLLVRGDVVLNIDGFKVWNDGTVEFRGKELIDFSYPITSRTDGETTLHIWHRPDPTELAGEERFIKAALVGRESCLMCPIYHETDCQPTYLICGGFVFCPMSGALIEEFIKTGFNNSSIIIDQALVNRATTQYKKSGTEKEIVTLLRILVHDCNYGYKLTVRLNRTNHVSKIASSPIDDMNLFTTLFRSPMSLPHLATRIQIFS
jgi:hypothetical protein